MLTSWLIFLVSEEPKTGGTNRRRDADLFRPICFPIPRFFTYYDFVFCFVEFLYALLVVLYKLSLSMKLLDLFDTFYCAASLFLDLGSSLTWFVYWYSGENTFDSYFKWIIW